MKTLFLKQDLPMGDLARLGLVKDGALLLDAENIDAMLTGRPTRLVRIKGLELNGFNIESLDARISLFREAEGNLKVKLHPIFKEMMPHPLLSAEDRAKMLTGEINSVLVTAGNSSGKSRNVVLEYDEQTRSILEYDPADVPVLKKVNGEILNEKQQADFAQGKIVELSDGTKFQHSASEPKGILSDRKALILSVLLDGGVSYLLLRGIKHLSNLQYAQKEEQSPGFKSEYEQLLSKIDDETLKLEKRQGDKAYGISR